MFEKALLALLLAVPILVAVVGLPTFGQLLLTATPTSAGAARPVVRTEQVTPTPAPTRFSPLNMAPPPTIAVPSRAQEPTPAPEATPTPTEDRRERVAIFNTGGAGAVLRSEPVSGRPVGALREGQALEVLERTNVNGAEWVRVRADNGTEGWIFGRVARPAEPGPATAAGTPTPRAGTPTPRAAATPGLTPTPAASPSASGRTHVVQPGDELRHIAARYGVSMASILASNVIPNPDSLTVGQTLVIPDPAN